MSVYLMSRVFYTPLPAHLKLTLLALADEAADDGTSICIGQRKLATKCGVSERSVRDHLKDLVGLGVLRKLDGKHPLYQTDQYEIAASKLSERPATSSAPRPATSSGADQTDRKLSVVPTGSGLPPTQLLTRNHIELSFDRFWKIYPKRVGRKPSRAAWERVMRTVPVSRVIAGAIAYRDNPKRDPDYTLNPLTWLNQARWEDEIKVAAPETGELAATDWEAYYRDQDERIRRLLEQEGDSA